MQAGTYYNDFAEIKTKITIEGVGGMAKLVDTQPSWNGKATLVTDTDVTIDHIEFSGATVSDGNGAGIRYQGGNLTITNSYFHDNQNGILGADDTAGSISISNSEFANNGSGTGYTHGIYIGDVGQLTVTNSYFHDTAVGHEIKSRAENSTITNNRIATGATGTDSYQIDLPNGGNAVIQNNTIEKGPHSENNVVVSYGEEGNLRGPAGLNVTGNTILNDANSSVVAVRNSTSTAATVSANSIYGVSSGNVLYGSGSVSGNTTLASDPGYSTASPIAAPTTALLPSLIPAGEPTTGLVLNVAEDAYQGDAQFTVSIDGTQVGGVFTATASHAAGGNQAITIVPTLSAGTHQVAVTFINDVYVGASADRNFYLNSTVYNGQAVAGGQAAMPWDSTTTFAVNAGSAASTPTPTTTPATTPTTTPATTPPSTTTPTLSAGLVLDVSEDAYNGDAQFTVTIDGTQVGGTYTASTLHSSGQTQAIAIPGTSTLSAGSHQVGISFINDAYGGSPSLDRNLYLDGAAYNGQAIAGASAVFKWDATDTITVNVPTASTATTPTTTTPVTTPTTTPTTTPATTTPSNSGTLVLNVSEDAYKGDAQFTVSVDGTQVGGVFSATASHAAGQSQAITISNTLGAGAHQFAVSFINDAYGGSASLDRNLYINGASYNGQAVQGAQSSLLWNATSAFDTDAGTVGPTSTLVLNVSEDAYQGDAQFAVTVDGKQLGGVYTATASHAAGQSQAITISGIAENFNPHDIAVSFLNDAYGGSPSTDRNLYVNSAQLDGQSVPSSGLTLLSNGAQHFTALAPANWTG